MTQEQWTGAVIGFSIATVFGALMFGAWYERRRGRQSSDPILAELIKPPKPMHVGFDAKLRAQAARKRERADRLTARASRIASSALTPKARRLPENATEFKRRA